MHRLSCCVKLLGPDKDHCCAAQFAATSTTHAAMPALKEKVLQSCTASICMPCRNTRRCHELSCPFHRWVETAFARVWHAPFGSSSYTLLHAACHVSAASRPAWPDRTPGIPGLASFCCRPGPTLADPNGARRAQGDPTYYALGSWTLANAGAAPCLRAHAMDCEWPCQHCSWHLCSGGAWVLGTSVAGCSSWPAAPENRRQLESYPGSKCPPASI